RSAVWIEFGGGAPISGYGQIQRSRVATLGASQPGKRNRAETSGNQEPRAGAVVAARHAAGGGAGHLLHRDAALGDAPAATGTRKSTRLNSSHVKISYAV